MNKLDESQKGRCYHGEFCGAQDPHNGMKLQLANGRWYEHTSSTRGVQATKKGLSELAANPGREESGKKVGHQESRTVWKRRLLAWLVGLLKLDCRSLRFGRCSWTDYLVKVQQKGRRTALWIFLLQGAFEPEASAVFFDFAMMLRLA